jgi:hypothetical protein
VEAASHGNALQTTLRCRAQLGKLREQDEAIVHALGQVCNPCLLYPVLGSGDHLC